MTGIKNGHNGRYKGRGHEPGRGTFELASMSLYAV